jgi:3-hydroxypropanoate dehydrogenase
MRTIPAPTNAPKILAPPLTVIVGHDLDFAEELPKSFPARTKDMRAYFSIPWSQKPPLFAYVIIAARAFWLDCGPMSGFTTHSLPIHASSPISSARSVTDRMTPFSRATRD